MIQIAALLAATIASPLQPSGKWIVEGESNMCGLIHSYGEGDGSVMLALRPWPLGGRTDILLFTRSGSRYSTIGRASFAIDGAKPLDGYYQSYKLAGLKRLTTFTLDAPTPATFAGARRVSISLDGGPPIEIALPEMGQALHALQGCSELLLKSMGIDPAWAEKIAKPAEPAENPQRWFMPQDYPPRAIHAGAEGISNLLLTIGIDGRATRCVTFGSSGDRDIDAAACKAYLARGRYRPALDAAGQPVISYLTVGSRWHLQY
jgi:hypothetical protein